jgi:hypothetical protein
VLDEFHAVERAAGARTCLVRQSTVNGALLAVIGGALVLRNDAATVTLLSAAIVAQIWLVAGLALATSSLHERARDVIADAAGCRSAAEVAAERRRLTSPRHRARLARTLAEVAHASEHWHEIAIGRRPPPGVRDLGEHTATIAEIVTLVREPGTSVRGVALLDRLVGGGYAATIFVGPSDGIGRELGRIRYLLAAASEPGPVADRGEA